MAKKGKNGQEPREAAPEEKRGAKEPTTQPPLELPADNQRMREKGKRAIMDIILENAQTIGIVVSILIGMRRPPKPGDPEEKRVPGWLLAAFSSLTGEDEIEYNIVLDASLEANIHQIEAEFRRRFIAEGYDETKYRLGLIGLHREFMEQFRMPVPQDKSGGRLKFSQITIKNSALEFLKQLADASGSSDEIYAAQKKAAIDRKLLLKTGGLHKVVHWIIQNKFAAVFLLILVLTMLICSLYWILYWILG